MKKRFKIVVTGAAGQVAYAFLFHLLSSKIFGEDVTLELRLLDLPNTLQRIHGVQMEIEDCLFSNLAKIICTSDANEAMTDVDLAVLIGSIPRRSVTASRADLIKDNSRIFKEQGLCLNNKASRDVKVLVVGNPCNTNCLVALNNAKDLSRDNFFAMTLLDENRARSLLAHKTEVNVNAVENVIVWGNHSSSMFPDFYHAKINDKFAHEVLSEKWLQEDFMHLVRNRGTEVIKARGVSSGASAASGIVGTLEKIFAGSREPYSLGCCSNGQYGVDEGLIFSFPYKNGKVVEGIAHASDFAKEQMQKTIEELRQEREIAREIGVIR